MTHTLSVKFLRVGQCRHLECMAARGGRLAMVDFPSFCGLIHHPDHGWILYDTGYAEHFFHATEQWPEKLYRSTLPVHLLPEENLLAQLQRHGVTADDIRLVVISHYHGDHVAGLKDFPNARFIALRADTEHLQAVQHRRWQATRQGLLPALLPADFFTRLTHADDLPRSSLPGWMSPFTEGFDLLGDKTLIAVPLPGHSHGQLGLLIPDADGRPVLLAGDACWSLPACREGRLPAIPTLLITANPKLYKKTFSSLKQLANRENSLSILPSHCIDSWEKFQHA